MVVVVVVVIVARTSSSQPYLFLLLPCPSLLQRASRTTHADSPPAGQFPWGRRRRKGRGIRSPFLFLAKFSELGFKSLQNG